MALQGRAIIGKINRDAYGYATAINPVRVFSKADLRGHLVVDTARAFGLQPARRRKPARLPLRNMPLSTKKITLTTRNPSMGRSLPTRSAAFTMDGALTFAPPESSVPEPTVPDTSSTSPDCQRWTYEQAIDFLFRRIDFERATSARQRHEFRLETTQQLFHRIGIGRFLHQPKRSSDDSANIVPTNTVPTKPPIPLVHIAGTKGKGSTATMVSAILTEAGYRTGLYTSPHLTDLEERFRVDGKQCERMTLAELVQSISSAVIDLESEIGHSVSFFELTTALAILYFDQNQCDAIVLEVGLGGRLDSTNVCRSSVAVVTSIGLDHQKVLGDTLEQIAGEKAGIIKSSVPVVSGVTQPGPAQVIRQAAESSKATLFALSDAFHYTDVKVNNLGSTFRFQAMAAELAGNENTGPPASPIQVGIQGAHQVHNASLAISTIRLLGDELPVTDSQIARGLAGVRCIGRVEGFLATVNDEAPAAASHTNSKVIRIVLDTAHNPDSIDALCRSVGSRRADGPLVFVFGTSRDKDYATMATQIAGIADQVVCTEFTTNPRAALAGDVSEILCNSKSADRVIQVACEPQPLRALHTAIKAVQASAATGSAEICGTVVICGSFFLAGELRPKLLAMPNVVPETWRAGARDAKETPAYRTDAVASDRPPRDHATGTYPEKEFL